MLRQAIRTFSGVIILGSITLCNNSIKAADAPSVELALKFTPVQDDVTYETPDPKQYDQCKVNVERNDKSSGWVVLGANGQVIRRFVDTNADNVVDQWRYFHQGHEVYRDIDSNYNNKVDQSRWLNTGGSRWGIDSDEDGQIDSWKTLSAQEAGRIAIQAMIDTDQRALDVICINAEDIKQLGISQVYAKKLLDSVASSGTQLRKVLADTKILGRGTKWMRFDSSTPGVIPSDEGKASSDLFVFENAMGIVEYKGKSELIQIGEMIRVGDVWKITQIPKPLEGEQLEVTFGGILMQPVLTASGSEAAEGEMSPEMQAVLKDLEKLDGSSPTTEDGPAALTKYNAARADLLAKLMKLSKTPQEREQWLRQLVDGLAATVQTGSYPAGLPRLKAIEADVRGAAGKSGMLPYVVYRRMLAQFTVELQKVKEEDRTKIRENWLKDMQRFVKTYPEAEDTPQAMSQIAVSYEFDGKIKDARKWYGDLVEDYGTTDSAKRAKGAIRRLGLKGKPFAFSGKSLDGDVLEVNRYRGKVVLVLFWSTWCKPCTEDLPQIRELYQKYRNQGFEIVGINLDISPDPVTPFLKQHRVTWPQIHEPGGLESNPATSFGIITLPTMFLVGSNGKVVSRSASVDMLKKQLPVLLKAR
jgi:thiol-disulfide isomerase/thioredoxin